MDDAYPKDANGDRGADIHMILISIYGRGLCEGTMAKYITVQGHPLNIETAMTRC